MHLAGADREVHSVERDDGAEHLACAGHLQDAMTGTCHRKLHTERAQWAAVASPVRMHPTCL
jgi:hypothetical protein